MNTPIVNKLIEYMNDNSVRFHMPGHKGRNSLFDWCKLIPMIDVTEIEGTDNLHNPTGVIKESQNLAAKAFGAKHTLFSVNGTTAGIYAAILSVTKPGDKIIIQRNCHKSVYNALIFGKLEPIYVYPSYDSENNIETGISPYDIEELLIKHNDIKAIVITYPTYYGVCSDIKKIAQIVKKHNKILVTDEAHGSHFKFSNRLPITALEAGADITVQSIHKTLPAFTQSSMIHVGSDKVDIQRLEEKLSMFQSTSPSYILMASLDMARAYMETNGKEKINDMLNKIDFLKGYLSKYNSIKIFDYNNMKNENFSDFDNSKLLINLTKLSICGKQLEEILRIKYNIVLEMSDLYYGVAMITVMDNEEDIEKLMLAIEDICKKYRKYNNDNKLFKIKTIIPKKELEIYEVSLLDKTTISLENSENKISGDFIIPYPPGIPIICPGETITKEIVRYLKMLKDNNINILGINEENKIKILK